MGVTGNLEGLFHPGGDTERIFRAAAATHSLAGGLRDMAKSLDSTAADMEKSWHGLGGKAGETAAAKYQSAWSKFSKAIVEYAGLLDTQADAIQKQGEALQQLQSQAVKLWTGSLASPAPSSAARSSSASSLAASALRSSLRWPRTSSPRLRV
jgi:uncharacterized protein YukE